MALPSLRPDWAAVLQATPRLQALIASIGTLPPTHRKLTAEIIMIRLFLLLETTFTSVAPKLLCGAKYLDGTTPARLVTPRSIAAALGEMKSHCRTQPKNYLRWTDSRSIRSNLKHTLAPSDPFFASVAAHGSLLTEMRFVRNQIAHSNSRTRINFRTVVVRHLGGVMRGITPGLLLLTPRLGPPCLLEQYVISSRVIIRALLRL